MAMLLYVGVTLFLALDIVSVKSDRRPSQQSGAEHKNILPTNAIPSSLPISLHTSSQYINLSHDPALR